MLTLTAPPVTDHERVASWFRRPGLESAASRRERVSVDGGLADMSNGVPISLYLPAPSQRAQAYSIFLNRLQNATSPAAIFSFYSSIVAVPFPAMKPQCTAILKAYGFSTRKIQLDVELVLPDSAVSSVEPYYGLVPLLDYHQIWLTFGQLLLLPFKDFNTTKSYSTWMWNTVKGLAASIRMDPEDSFFALDHERANMIRSAFGFADEFKRSILDQILAVASSQVSSVPGKICNCVANMLQYAEMEDVILIYRTLVATNSPVMRDSAVAMEVIELADGLDAVVKFEQKEYFGLLADPFQSRLIEKDRFPTLFSVAVAVSSHRESSVLCSSSNSADSSPESPDSENSSRELDCEDSRAESSNSGDSSPLICCSSEVLRLTRLHATGCEIECHTPDRTAIASQPDPTAVARAIDFLSRCP